MTKLADFYDQLAGFDWYYMMSDDNSVWRHGERKMAELSAAAKESPEHQKLFDAWHAHRFSGKPWGTEQAPKPERPQVSGLSQITRTEDQ